MFQLVVILYVLAVEDERMSASRPPPRLITTCSRLSMTIQHNNAPSILWAIYMPSTRGRAMPRGNRHVFLRFRRRWKIGYSWILLRMVSPKQAMRMCGLESSVSRQGLSCCNGPWYSTISGDFHDRHHLNYRPWRTFHAISYIFQHFGGRIEGSVAKRQLGKSARELKFEPETAETKGKWTWTRRCTWSNNRRLICVASN